MLVLLVEDDPAVAAGVRDGLTANGYTVHHVATGAEALKAAGAMPAPELVLLDLGLPDIDGRDVCRSIRNASAVPIIVISARDDEVDKVVGLELGADDYLTKPFSPRELVLRVRKRVERRQSPVPGEKPERLEFGELLVDIPRHLVTVAGKRADLTATEFKLLTTLMQRRGRVQSRDQLLQDVWEYDNVIDTRTVDTHMRRLRDKLGRAARYLDTVRGVGYRFVED